MKPLTLDEVNIAPDAQYLAHLEALYEYSPWVVERSLALRPFESLPAIQSAFERIIFSATKEEQFALLGAHPDLAAKIEKLADLTDFSQAEQSRAGFAALDPQTLESLRSLLAEYRDKFGHPFILCVSDFKAEDTLSILKVRVASTPVAESVACLAQVCRIGWHRLQQLVS